MLSFLKSIGNKSITTNDLILVTKGHLGDLLHSYEDGSEITEKELIENRCGIELNKDNYITGIYNFDLASWCPSLKLFPLLFIKFLLFNQITALQKL